MTDDERYSLDSARRAAREGRVAEWVGEFLCSPGSNNAVLAAALAEEKRWWLGPVRVPLSQLNRLAGPEEDEVLCPIDEDEWEEDLEEMQDSIERGWQPPPVLASFHADGLHLEDGNHRAESLRRAGEHRAWAIICFDDELDYQRFAAHLAARGEAPAAR
jgi:hypothetical protein